ncbi:MAG: CbiQ family ECF transporter T component [Micropruina sp.]
MAAEGTPTLTVSPSLAFASGRGVHPWAWWGWALLISFGVNLTTNPLLLGLLAFTVIAVVILRRSDAPWARSIGIYLGLAGMVIVTRLFFQIIAGGTYGTTVLFGLPEVPLPEWAAGIRLGGPVTAEALVYTLYDGLRLATMLLCLGAANALANPRTALKSVPAALYEASVAVVIALSVAPQLIESALRVRRARRLRGGTRTGWRSLQTVVIPVLEDAIERSVALAAGMEARGFARTRQAHGQRFALTLMLIASMVLLVGLFLLLEGSEVAVGWASLVLGLTGVTWGLRLAGRRLRATRYRPQPWRPSDSAIILCGAGVAAAIGGLRLIADQLLNPGTEPLVWPVLHPLMLAVVGAAALPLAFSRPQLQVVTR